MSFIADVVPDQHLLIRMMVTASTVETFILIVLSVIAQLLVQNVDLHT